jgi:Zn-dependent protease with chaperone function
MFLSALAATGLLFAFAASGETTKEFDTRIESQLGGLDPAAVEIWNRANVARNSQLHAVAATLYAQVYRRVPQFNHALRRQANEEAEMGRRDLALTHLRAAVAAERTSENLSALADVLSGNPGGIDEAKSLAQESVEKNPDGAYEYGMLAQVATKAQDLELLKRATGRLQLIAPRNPATHAYLAIVAIARKEWSSAREELEQAKALGLEDSTYDSLSSSINRGMPFYARWWKPFALAIGAWCIVFALLLLLGAMLSRVALRAARELPSSLAENATALGSRVRKIYAAVLGASSAFYYASIPIVIALVIIVCGGAIYATFALGHIPIKLIIMLVVVGGTTVWSMLKSVFIKPADDDPGQRLDLAKQPRLRAMLDDVAAKIGTRAVDNVYLTPGTELAVMQRGKGQRERCLILGIAAIEGMKIRPFKAVLGHEYGHFVNRDTAGGSFALSVRRSLNATAYALATGGAATWYNPAWHFVRAFNRVFLRISEGASRLQEVLADRWAVFAYGADAFEQGLRHVIERSVRFDAHASATLKEVVDRKLPLANLYTYQPATNAATDEIEKKVAESLNREASIYDSHPSPAERFALVHALPAHGHESASNDDAEAWTLFDNPEELQLAMTTQVRANVAMNYGIAIPAPA